MEVALYVGDDYLAYFDYLSDVSHGIYLEGNRWHLLRPHGVLVCKFFLKLFSFF